VREEKIGVKEGRYRRETMGAERSGPLFVTRRGGFSFAERREVPQLRTE
jgi:hypothetical protein